MRVLIAAGGTAGHINPALAKLISTKRARSFGRSSVRIRRIRTAASGSLATMYR